MKLTSRSHFFSISFILTTAATRRMSTEYWADTALSGMPLTMTSRQIISLAFSDSTGSLRKCLLAGNGMSGCVAPASDPGMNWVT